MTSPLHRRSSYAGPWRLRKVALAETPIRHPQRRYFRTRNILSKVLRFVYATQHEMHTFEYLIRVPRTLWHFEPIFVRIRLAQVVIYHLKPSSLIEKPMQSLPLSNSTCAAYDQLHRSRTFPIITLTSHQVQQFVAGLLCRSIAPSHSIIAAHSSGSHAPNRERKADGPYDFACCMNTTVQSPTLMLVSVEAFGEYGMWLTKARYSRLTTLYGVFE